MSDHDQLYLHATRELAEQRARLAPEQAKAFRACTQSVFAEGALTTRAIQLIAVTVVHVTLCSYCIRSHTREAVRHGATPEQIMEAIWIAAEMRADASCAHSTLVVDAIANLQAESGAKAAV
jgi:AhpD family alkylhydroperoxidase